MSKFLSWKSDIINIKASMFLLYSSSNQQNDNGTKEANQSIIPQSNDETFDFGYNYDLALSYSGKLSYPYAKYYLTDDTIRQYFNQLKSYPVKVVNERMRYHYRFDNEKELMFRGNYYTIINYPDEWPNLEIMSDYFNHPVRSKCIHKPDTISSYDYFESNYNDIINEMRKRNLRIIPQNMDDIINEIGPKVCSMFKPKIFIHIVKLFGAKKVLDISSGWGDRLIGAIASDVEEYQGFDPNHELQDGYNKIIDFFGVSKAKFNVQPIPFENAILKQGYYDIVMTSPPYFDIEVYTSSRQEDQSIHQRNEKQWYTQMLKRWIDIVYNSLQVGGILALNIHTIRGYSFVQWLINDMRNDKRWRSLGLISYSKPSLTNPQPIFIWEKMIQQNVNKQQNRYDNKGRYNNQYYSYKNKI
jgi:hypothetical protein